MVDTLFLTKLTTFRCRRCVRCSMFFIRLIHQIVEHKSFLMSHSIALLHSFFPKSLDYLIFLFIFVPDLASLERLASNDNNNIKITIDMNKTILSTAVSAVLLFSMCSTTQAKSWRINNDTSKGAKFTSIQAATESELVTAGDTLFLDPGCTLTSQQVIKKRVTIIGCGYFRASTPHAFATVTAPIAFDPGSSGSKLESLICTGEYISIYVDNITIERCRTRRIQNTNSSSNCVIRQCYVEGPIQRSYGTINAWTVENCICFDGISNLQNSTVQNNFIWYNSNGAPLYDLQNTIVRNNVIINNYNKNSIFSSLTDCTKDYNVISAESKTNEHDIALNSTNIGDVFTNTGNNDELYKLKEGSPAIGAGLNGVDCGPTGGNFPYVYGGMPAYHPYYTNAVISPKDDGTGVNVSLKILMQNE